MGSEPTRDGSVETKLCPSARCEPGAILLGVVKDDGTVGHLPMPLTVDEDFVAEADADGQAETRFRFASPCQRAGCRQWENGGCGVVRDVTDHAGTFRDAALPRCSIRSTCQWFSERKDAACRTCRFVVTDDRASSLAYPA